MGCTGESARDITEVLRLWGYGEEETQRTDAFMRVRVDSWQRP